MKPCEVCGYDLNKNRPAKSGQRVCSNKNGNPKTQILHKEYTTCYLKRNKKQRKDRYDDHFIAYKTKGEKLRTCLRCDREFKSLSVGNRLCISCKNSPPGEDIEGLSLLNRKIKINNIGRLFNAY